MARFFLFLFGELVQGLIIHATHEIPHIPDSVTYHYLCVLMRKQLWVNGMSLNMLPKLPYLGHDKGQRAIFVVPTLSFSGWLLLPLRFSLLTEALLN